MFTFELQVPGDELPQIKVGFARAGLRVKDLRPAWVKVHDLLREESRKQFSSEGSHGSGGWASLSPEYAARKLKAFGPRPILHATERLRQAYTRKSADHVEVSKPLELRHGASSRLDYAKFHQGGTRRMPRRPPMQLTAKARKQIEVEITETIRDEFLAARRGGVA
jgi:phage gpG-like protein